jgi:hypothetical protein
VTWLAHWKENINGNSKYVFLSAGSTWKGQSDRQKFEKARELQVRFVETQSATYLMPFITETRRSNPKRLYSRPQEQDHGGQTESNGDVPDRQTGFASG